MERWRGKVAVVTGAAGGIGSAIVEKLAQEGLVVVGIDANINDKAKQKILQCDLTDLAKLADTFKTIEATYGGVDVMVNCAGFAKFGHITSTGNKISDKDLATVIDVNIRAVIFCCRHAVDSMNKRGVDGHIININSIAGHYVMFSHDYNAYSSSKYAVTAFTQSLMQEMARFKRKIRVTSVSPGLVKTAMTSGTSKDFSVDPSLQPSDIADSIVYVLSTPPHVNISEITVQPVGDIRL